MSSDEKGVKARGFMMKRGNGRVKGLKLSRTRKLNWKPFSMFFVLSRKIGKMYGDFVKKLMKMDELACPAIVFSTQWGLPVLSHNSVSRRKNPISCYKSLTWL
ncbi:hypothetical protein BUALT_Bualt19G0012000 [Buddleja alternifolia]|uniref:Uncharacterized protein n=1 Tax=Buddleja alternifolia TaxID=168488 RepID=A0AAV6W8F7_9LAMI|nr:hypothetical protein BUALT_Bualt19G0012000 [Buddleja alternifolia]